MNFLVKNPSFVLLTQSHTRRFSNIYVNHRNTEDNNEDTPFEFTPENYEKVQKMIAKYPPNYRESAVIPVLFIA